MLWLAILTLSHFETQAQGFKPAVYNSSQTAQSAAQPQAQAPLGTLPAASTTKAAQPATGTPTIVYPAMGDPKFNPRPNISTNDGKSGAAQIIQQFINALTGGGNKVPPKTLPNGQPNPAYSNSVGGGTPYANEYGPPVINNYDQLANWPINNSDNINGHRCKQKSQNPRTCMICNLCFEASNQSDEGQIAVARSVMTRVFSRAYPGNICDVIYQPRQYSWTHENKSHGHVLPAACANLNRVIANAEKGIKQGPFASPEVTYTNYFAHNIVFPPWAREGTCAATLRRIGDHTFCNIKGTTTRTVAEVESNHGIGAGTLRQLTSASNTPAQR
jgi:spore germination cell wall hydrolase CwlJ-like protein